MAPPSSVSSPARSASTPPPSRRGSRTAKIALVVGVLAALALAYRLGVFQQLGDPARLAETLVRLGPWGYLAFVVAFAMFQPFGVPGTGFVMVAPLIWPWPTAFALSMTGAMAASVIGFSFSRFVARDWIAARIPARFQKYNDALERRALRTVFLLRLIFWMPQYLHAFFGVSKVSFTTHFWGTLAGYVLPLLMVSYFGQQLFDALKVAPAGVWVAGGAAIVTIALGVWALRRSRAGRMASVASAPTD